VVWSCESLSGDRVFSDACMDVARKSAKKPRARVIAAQRPCLIEYRGRLEAAACWKFQEVKSIKIYVRSLVWLLSKVSLF